MSLFQYVYHPKDKIWECWLMIVILILDGDKMGCPHLCKNIVFCFWGQCWLCNIFSLIQSFLMFGKITVYFPNIRWVTAQQKHYQFTSLSPTNDSRFGPKLVGTSIKEKYWCKRSRYLRNNMNFPYKLQTCFIILK